MKTQEEKPTVDAELLLDTARKFAGLFNKKLSNDIIEDVAQKMRDGHDFNTATVIRDAQDMLFLEQHPEAVVFQNSATMFVAKNGNEHWQAHWQAIKQVGKETMLGDFRDFINTLIAKHGSHAKFYLDSDHGDEYFVLTLKKDKK